MASSEPAESQAALQGQETPKYGQKEPPQQETVTNGRPIDAEARPPETKRVSYLSLNHKRQLALLCLARIADPIAQTSVQVSVIQLQCDMSFNF